jgi:hypothetical protein
MPVTRNDWWASEPVTLPAVQNSPVKKQRRRTRFYTAYIWVSVVLLPFALLAVGVLATQQLRTTAADSPTSVNADIGTAQAQAHVERWLAQQPSPLPGGRVVTFTGATSKTPAPQAEGDPVTAVLTTYSFVVADRSGNLFTTTVQMEVSPERGAVALASPALLPLPASRSDSAAVRWPWPGVAPGVARPAHTPAVNAWAKAYTSGDPATLKQIVGDPEEGRSYVPLSGVTFSDASITQAGALWGEDQDQAENAQPRQMLLRVGFRVTWDGQSPSSTKPTLTYDLLVDRADTAAPVVVAWASPGMELTPYGNAVAGRTVAAAPPPAGPSPSASPSPAPTPTPRRR